jgi:lipopolysaccharide/colanic/teichoic acid biosynthesis glycosyltransferase
MATTATAGTPDTASLIEDMHRHYSRPGSWRRTSARLAAGGRFALVAATRSLSAFLKRALDVAVSGTLLLGLAPFFAAIALVIKLTDRGPVLYWQTRIGRHGRPFPFPKFRTMVVDAERRLREISHLNQHGAGVTFKMKSDPRVTGIGRLLRRFSLDELPQLWCVLRGQMTLVGPRPPVPREVARYSLSDRVRLEVVPGLTCIWQVSGRSDIPFERQVELDRDYIFQQSVWLDVKILARTVPAVVTARGAY